MSMYEVEYYIEAAIKAVANSDLSVGEKRNMIYSLLQLEDLGDCGFTNLRTLTEMVACRYTFLFPKEDMYDYKSNKPFYERELPSKNTFVQGDVYLSGNQICVDSGSEAWRGMVKKGAIQGVGASPVIPLDDLYVLKRCRELIGPMDDFLLQTHLEMFLLSGAMDSLPEDEYSTQFGKTKTEIDDEMMGIHDI